MIAEGRRHHPVRDPRVIVQPTHQALDELVSCLPVPLLDPEHESRHALSRRIVPLLMPAHSLVPSCPHQSLFVREMIGEASGQSLRCLANLPEISPCVKESPAVGERFENLFVLVIDLRDEYRMR
jgi:hypothetical protein